MSLGHAANIFSGVPYTVFPRIVSAETILFWLWPYVLWPLITVHKCAETIQVRKLFKGGNYSRKYGNLKILQIWQQIWGPVMMEKIPLDIGNYILFLNCGFVIDSNISGKYQPIWVSVLILDLNQNSGFDRTLCGTNSSPLRHIMIQWIPQFF